MKQCTHREPAQVLDGDWLFHMANKAPSAVLRLGLTVTQGYFLEISTS